jgi:hypothetical protein
MNSTASGLRIRVIKGVHPDVRKACIEFARWLRKSYEFPMRVIVYIKPQIRIKTFEGKSVVGIFFAPYDKNVEPYIKIATGDYLELLGEIGKDNALASLLRPIAHEYSHYIQWLNNEEFSERKASRLSRKIMDSYYEIRENL